MNMPAPKRTSLAKVAGLLKRYQCPVPFHAVRALFMGSLASPVPDPSPIQAVQTLWGGEFPPFDTLDDLNNLLHALVDGLWNRLTVHQTAGKPFKLTRTQVRQTREGLHHYAMVRKQEIEAFMDGLFGPHDELDLPETARDAVDTLGQIRAMFEGATNLLADADVPAAPDSLTGLADNLQALEPIVEQEINAVVLSCTRARRQLLADPRGPKPTVH